jgi:hypothetical protein
MENQYNTIRNPDMTLPLERSVRLHGDPSGSLRATMLALGVAVSEALEAYADTGDLDPDTYRKVMMLRDASDFAIDGATSLASGTDLMGPNADTLAEWAMWKLTEYSTSRTTVL